MGHTKPARTSDAITAPIDAATSYTVTARRQPHLHRHHDAVRDAATSYTVTARRCGRVWVVPSLAKECARRHG